VGGLVPHILARFQQVVFEFENAPAGTQPGLQLSGIEGFDEVIVGAGFQALHDVLFGAL
jgi:hypothetical protein